MKLKISINFHKFFILFVIVFIFVSFKNVFAVTTINEDDFFSKFSYSQDMNLINTFRNSGNYTQAKQELLTYYKNKFTNIETNYNYSNSRSLNYLTAFNTVAFSEEYLGNVIINTKSYAEYTINLNNSISGNYVLTALKKSTDLIRILTKENSSDDDKPRLIITNTSGETISLYPTKDCFIRPGIYANNNYGSSTAMFARHTVDGSTPYSAQSMRSYLAFSIPSSWKKNVKSVVLKVKARLSADSGEAMTDESIPLVAMDAYYTDWTENNLTWNKVFQANGIGHFSYNGISGGFDWQKPAGTPSEFLNYNMRFYEIASLCQEGDLLKSRGNTSDAKGAYTRAKNLILDFINDAGSATPSKRSIEPANRLLEFPAIYKALLTNDIITSEENYKILCWLYLETDSLYNDTSNQLFNGATDTVVKNSNGAYQAYTNHGAWHLAGFYSSIAYFNEFSMSSNWKNIFQKRLTKIINYLITSDGSYNESNFGYPMEVISWMTTMVKTMEIFSDTSSSSLIKSKLISLGIYLIYCSYPDGSMPFWGQGKASSDSLKTSLNKIIAISKNVSGSDLTKLNQIKDYLNGNLAVSMMKYPNINIVTDRTGWNASNSMIFMNAKVGGSHGHRDTLALLFNYKGRQLLTDTGTTSYDLSNSQYSWQNLQTKSHNTIEINGTSQNFDNEIIVNESNINISGNSNLSNIKSSTTATNGFTHYRNVLYAKSLGEFLIVFDYVKPDNQTTSNTYTQNWHTEPGTNSTIENNQYKTGKTSYDTGSNLIIAQANTTGMTAIINSGYDASQPATTTKYFTYQKKGVGNTYYQTVLYPVNEGANTSIINVAPVNLVCSNIASAIRIDIDDSNNPNKMVYAYSAYSSPVLYSFKDSSKNRTISTDAEHAVLSYNANSKVRMAYLSNGKQMIISNENLLISSDIQLTDLSVTINGQILEIISSDSNVSSLKAVMTINLNNQIVKSVKINGVSLSNNSYQQLNGVVTIKSNGYTKDYLLGDVNADGVISSLDYIMIRRHLMGNITLNSSQKKYADMNGDNKISALDYIAIKNIIMGGY